MNEYHDPDLGVSLYRGDCLEVVTKLDGVTAVVCDPPYGLTSGGQTGFMGNAWDRCVPGRLFWERIAAACLPGAPLLAFGGTRTFHRLVTMRRSRRS